MKEYKSIQVSGTWSLGSELAMKIEKAINKEAAEGWELCDFELQDGRWFFVGWGKYAIIVMSRDRKE